MKNKIFFVVAFALVIASYFSAIDGAPLLGFDFGQVSFFSGVVLFVILLITIPIWFKEEDEKQDSFPFWVFICFMMFLLLSLVLYVDVFKKLNIASGLDIMISGFAGLVATVIVFFSAALIHDAFNSINYPKVDEDE
jgi:hypothetical protein